MQVFNKESAGHVSTLSLSIMLRASPDDGASVGYTTDFQWPAWLCPHPSEMPPRCLNIVGPALVFDLGFRVMSLVTARLYGMVGEGLRYTIRPNMSRLPQP